MRSERLKARRALPHGNNDGSPQSDSTGLLGRGRAGLRRRRQPTAARLPNVLAEDTWDLFRVLLR